MSEQFRLLLEGENLVHTSQRGFVSLAFQPAIRRWRAIVAAFKIALAFFKTIMIIESLAVEYFRSFHFQLAWWR